MGGSRGLIVGDRRNFSIPAPLDTGETIITFCRKVAALGTQHSSLILTKPITHSLKLSHGSKKSEMLTL